MFDTKKETEYDWGFESCCRNNSLKGVEECLSKGADVNRVFYNIIGDGLQLTGLMIACREGNPGIVNRLLQVEGVLVNYQGVRKETAAHWACQGGHEICVELLVKVGTVNWNLRNRDGQTPLDLAIKYRHRNIEEILRNIPDIAAFPQFES